MSSCNATRCVMWLNSADRGGGAFASSLLQRFLQRLDQCGWQHGHPIFQTFSVTYDELVEGEIQILYAEADAFHDPKAGAIEELSLELVLSSQGSDEVCSLVPGEDGGETLRLLGADARERKIQLHFQDIFI